MEADEPDGGCMRILMLIIGHAARDALSRRVIHIKLSIALAGSSIRDFDNSKVVVLTASMKKSSSLSESSTRMTWGWTKL